jgi:hypothetical protein
MTHSNIDTWKLIRAALAISRGDALPKSGTDYVFNGNSLETIEAHHPSSILRWENGWRLVSAHPPARQAFFDLYLPLVGYSAAPWVLGQLGQSIDGFIATAGGQSH